MLVLIDLVTTLGVDLRRLHPELAKPPFLQAIRTLRLLHTPEGTWDRYREGRLVAQEARLVTEALEEHLAPVPEYGRLVCLACAHDGAGPTMKPVTITAQTAQEERGVLEAFWQHARPALRDPQLVSYGGMRWGTAFLVRRTLLQDLAPSAWVPTGRATRELHFDVEDVLANGDRTRLRPLELAALQYGIPGPWTDPANAAGADTAGAIRQAVADGDRERAHALALARLMAVWALYKRLAATHVK